MRRRRQRFAGSAVFITGASSGIGAALSLEFAREGADVVLAARRRDRLESLAAEIGAIGRRAVVFPCDVTREGDLERAAAAGRAAFGKLDVVVANAGFGVTGLLERLSLDDYRRQLETNVFGVLRTVYATLEDLKKSRGRLVVIGSVSGHVAVAGSSPYSMSKFAVRALAASLGYELAEHGVSVTLISPGFVESEIRQVDNRGVLQDGQAGAADSRRDGHGDADRGAKNRERGGAAAPRSGDHRLREGRGAPPAAPSGAARGNNSTFRY